MPTLDVAPSSFVKLFFRRVVTFTLLSTAFRQVVKQDPPASLRDLLCREGMRGVQGMLRALVLPPFDEPDLLSALSRSGLRLYLSLSTAQEIVLRHVPRDTPVELMAAVSDNLASSFRQLQQRLQTDASIPVYDALEASTYGRKTHDAIVDVTADVRLVPEHGPPLTHGELAVRFGRAPTLLDHILDSADQQQPREYVLSPSPPPPPQPLLPRRSRSPCVLTPPPLPVLRHAAPGDPMIIDAAQALVGLSSSFSKSCMLNLGNGKALSVKERHPLVIWLRRVMGEHEFHAALASPDWQPLPTTHADDAELFRRMFQMFRQAAGKPGQVEDDEDMDEEEEGKPDRKRRRLTQEVVVSSSSSSSSSSIIATPADEETRLPETVLKTLRRMLVPPYTYFPPTPGRWTIHFFRPQTSPLSAMEFRDELGTERGQRLVVILSAFVILKDNNLLQDPTAIERLRWNEAQVRSALAKISQTAANADPRSPTFCADMQELSIQGVPIVLLPPP